MLTRLKVSGFKNLVDVDVRFGPFTCIAGANGVGKSNLFDAITFLGTLADKPIIDAALSVRDETGRSGDVRHLFHRVGDLYDEKMCFEAEIIVPEKGIDDLGQEAKASSTFLRYTLHLAYRNEDSPRSLGRLEIVKEDLVHIKVRDAHRNLGFPHQANSWRKSVIRGSRTVPFISTIEDNSRRLIRIHQDSKNGRPRQLLATTLPRTALSAANAVESPTALLARREMQSWRLLQLEPSSLRSSDSFTAPTRLGADGSHLASTIYNLARLEALKGKNGDADAKAEKVYSQIANRLSELIEDVKRVYVDRDEQRELLTLNLVASDGTSHPARALSDGTLRFLALAVFELDPNAPSLICLEEPENGIHPKRIPAILSLLGDIATDVYEREGPDNPLRQVIVNTHSPAVVAQVPDDSLVVAEGRETVRDGKRFSKLVFACLPGTWRAELGTMERVTKGKLLAYLNPVPFEDEPSRSTGSRKRVIDREDLYQLTLPYGQKQ
jgi:predicted ATPase